MYQFTYLIYKLVDKNCINSDLLEIERHDIKTSVIDDIYLHYLFDDSIIDYIVNCKFYYCIPLSIFN